MSEFPKIVALCPAYNRPRLLGQAIAMFLAQDYPNKELVILEDSGIFGEGETIVGDGWRIVSTARRFKSVGAKRNELIRLSGADLFASWDDDDWYMPWHLSAAVNALRKGNYCQPRQALEWESPGVLSRHWVVSAPVLDKLQRGQRLAPVECWDICYGGQWSFRAAPVLKVGGYPESRGNGDDTELCRTLGRRFGNSVDAICAEYPLPSYVYSRNASGSWHASELGPGTKPLAKLAEMPREDPDELIVELPQGYAEVEVPNEVRARNW